MNLPNVIFIHECLLNEVQRNCAQVVFSLFPRDCRLLLYVTTILRTKKRKDGAFL